MSGRTAAYLLLAQVGLFQLGPGPFWPWRAVPTALSLAFVVVLWRRGNARV